VRIATVYRFIATRCDGTVRSSCCRPGDGAAARGDPDPLGRWSRICQVTADLGPDQLSSVA